MTQTLSLVFYLGGLWPIEEEGSTESGRGALCFAPRHLVASVLEVGRAFGASGEEEEEEEEKKEEDKTPSDDPSWAMQWMIE